MSFLSHVEIAHLLATYGYVVVALMVGVEGMGIPVPGEATLQTPHEFPRAVCRRASCTLDSSSHFSRYLSVG